LNNTILNAQRQSDIDNFTYSEEKPMQKEICLLEGDTSPFIEKMTGTSSYD
jgi:hypothetical protein